MCRERNALSEDSHRSAGVYHSHPSACLVACGVVAMMPGEFLVREDVLFAARLAEFCEGRAYRGLAEAGAKILGLQVDATDLCGAIVLRSEHKGLGTLLNRVIGLGLREPITAQTIASLTAHYRGIPAAWSIELTPPAATPDVVAMLRSIPLRRGLATAVLAVNCSHATPWPSTFQVVKCEGQPSAEGASIEAAVFGVSDTLKSLLAVAPLQSCYRQWLAYDRARPVGACLTHVDHEGAWFGWSATLPEYRGRGVQRTLLAHCLDDAAAAGCRWMTAETAIGTDSRPDPSFRNMRRAGFIELYRRHSHLFLPRRPTAPSSDPPPRNLG